MQYNKYTKNPIELLEKNEINFQSNKNDASTT